MMMMMMMVVNFSFNLFGGIIEMILLDLCRLFLLAKDSDRSGPARESRDVT